MVHKINKTSLTEVTRWEILRRSQSESPDRYMKKNKYSPKDFKNVDFEELFENNTFTWSTRVHGQSNYIVTISFEGPFDLLKYELKSIRGKNRWKRITLDMVTKALSRALDTEDLYVNCSCPDFCLEENTQIKLLNGEVYSIKELLTKFNNGEEIWVYSTDDKGDFRPGRVTDIWISGQVNEIIEVTLDNDKVIKTTPNHLYMQRDGEYIRADQLKVGQSLMPLYFKYFKGYEDVMLNSRVKSFVSVYKTVANEVLQNEIELAKQRSNEKNIAIHHSDFNKLNNYPSNLKPMGVLEHWNYHCKHIKDNPELLKKWKEAGHTYWRTEEGRSCLSNYNHKVKSIRKIILNNPINVYDLTVDKYNNFYVDAGVILHNCYRFKYWATQANCNYGVPQNTPPKVRNVRNNKGYCCKHILAILYGKRWVQSAAKAWLLYMQANPELTEYYIWGKDYVSDNTEDDE